MSITFSTTAYEWTHGRAPKGRGSWAFGASRNATGDEIIWAPSLSTLTEAKKFAAKVAAERGISVLHVLP